MDWYVADSYKNFERIGEPFDNEGKMYIKIKATCPRCQGTGNYSYCEVYGTTCFQCGGRKYITQTVRAYNEKEYNRMRAANERTRQRKQAEREAREKDLIENAATYKHELALLMGFNDEEKIYLIKGGNTYNIKDYLKENNCHFNNILKWYSSCEIEVPEGYYLLEISFDDIYTYIPLQKKANLKENAEELIAEKAGPATQYYPAQEKDKISDIAATFDSVSGFQGMYGYTYVYTFKSGNYVFIWMTTKSFSDLNPGDAVTLSGTIKKFTVYDGVHQTHLTRCTLVK